MISITIKHKLKMSEDRKKTIKKTKAEGCFNCEIEKETLIRGKFASCKDHDGKSENKGLCIVCILESNGEITGVWKDCERHKRKNDEIRISLHTKNKILKVEDKPENSELINKIESKNTLKNHSVKASNIKKLFIAKYTKELGNTGSSSNSESQKITLHGGENSSSESVSTDRTPDSSSDGRWHGEGTPHFEYTSSSSNNDHESDSGDLDTVHLKLKMVGSFKKQGDDEKSSMTDLNTFLEKRTNSQKNIKNIELVDNNNQGHFSNLQRTDKIPEGEILGLADGRTGNGKEAILTMTPPNYQEVMNVSFNGLCDVNSDQVAVLWKTAIFEVLRMYQAENRLTNEVANEIATHIAAMIKLTSNVYVHGSHVAVALIKDHNGHIARERERTSNLQREILNRLDANSRPCIDQQTLLQQIRNIVSEAAGQRRLEAGNVQTAQISEDIYQKIKRLLNLQNGTVSGNAASTLTSASAQRITPRSDNLYEIPFGKTHEVFSADQINCMVKNYKESQSNPRGGQNTSGGHSSAHPYTRGHGPRGGGGYRGKGMKRPYDGRETRSFAENYVKGRVAKSQGREVDFNAKTNQEVLDEGAKENATTAEKARSGLALEQRTSFIEGVLRPKARFVFDTGLQAHREWRPDDLDEDDADIYILEKNVYLSVKTKKAHLEREFGEKFFNYHDPI